MVAMVKICIHLVLAVARLTRNVWTFPPHSQRLTTARLLQRLGLPLSATLSMRKDRPIVHALQLLQNLFAVCIPLGQVSLIMA